jgi:hypothetical protein
VIISALLELLDQDDKRTYYDDELSQKLNSIYHHIVTLGDSKLLVSVVAVIKMASRTVSGGAMEEACDENGWITDADWELLQSVVTVNFVYYKRSQTCAFTTKI